MITVGLIRELYFLALVSKKDIQASLVLQERPPIDVKITKDGILTVQYKSQVIWRESVAGSASFFGVESCDTIARIIACIDNGTSWKHLSWIELS